MYRLKLRSVLAAFASLLISGAAAGAGVGPVLGGALPGPLPLFPADNWWNTDISGAPVDAGSQSFINFIGGTRALHPDMGGEVSPGSVATYGMPFCVVDGDQPKKQVVFQYWDESDGNGVPFYPIPDQAITQAHWVEGGEPGSVDLRADEDRHLLIVDRDNKLLYELYNVWYDTGANQWHAGSGAFFDLKTNDRRPDGWTSADAAGLAILPGLVRYDEVYDGAITDIGHAFRVTVRATNGYVYPGSHRAGSTSGALPMGARLRLKTTDANGQDPALRTADPNMRKVFRAMQKYGLIVADNGSDMYITGTFDTRWNNDVLNPAFGLLKAGDFQVVQLGWKPATGPVTLSSLSVSPSSVTGGSSSTGTVTLSGPAPSGGVTVTLGSNNAAAQTPASMTIGSGVTSQTFTVTTSVVGASTAATISATYSGVTKTANLTVNPVPPPPPVTVSALSLSPSTVDGGTPSTATVTLSANAPSGGTVVTLTSSKPAAASVPGSVTVPAGTKTASVTVTTFSVNTNTSAVITASANSSSRSATLTVRKRRGK